MWGDLLYGSLPEAEQEMKDILAEFQVKQVLDTEFRFCGKEVFRNADYSILVTARDNTEKIRPIDIGVGQKLTEKCGATMNTALRSVVASLAWVARQVRPTLSLRVRKLQSVAGTATMEDVRECNKVLEYALSTWKESSMPVKASNGTRPSFVL